VCEFSLHTRVLWSQDCYLIGGDGEEEGMQEKITTKLSVNVKRGRFQSLFFSPVNIVFFICYLMSFQIKKN
jgi:hypothetical protein